jgi:hypothetical protein
VAKSGGTRAVVSQIFEGAEPDWHYGADALHH